MPLSIFQSMPLRPWSHVKNINMNERYYYMNVPVMYIMYACIYDEIVAGKRRESGEYGEGEQNKTCTEK